MSLYHLLAVRKDRRWLLLALAALAAIGLAAPQLRMMLTGGVAYAQEGHGPKAASLAGVLEAWITVVSNGAPALLALSAAGCIVGWRRGILRGNAFLPLFPLLIVSIAIAGEVSGVISGGQMRYLLAGAPIVAAFAAAGIHALCRLRAWLGLVSLLWLAAGLTFQLNADWNFLIQARTWSYSDPPWHLLSRWMQASGEQLPALTIGVTHRLLYRSGLQADELKRYYFRRHGIGIAATLPNNMAPSLAAQKMNTPGYWIVYQSTKLDASDINSLDSVMAESGYMPCAETTFPASAVVRTYRWANLACQTQARAVFATAIGSYRHFGVAQDDAGGQLQIIGEWQSDSPSADGARNLSLQALNAEARNVAQLDLPLAHVAGMRQLALDIAHLPGGDYELAAIVYDSQTGERFAWQNNESPMNEMQLLAGFAIADKSS